MFTGPDGHVRACTAAAAASSTWTKLVTSSSMTRRPARALAADLRDRSSGAPAYAAKPCPLTAYMRTM